MTDSKSPARARRAALALAYAAWVSTVHDYKHGKPSEDDIAEADLAVEGALIATGLLDAVNAITSIDLQADRMLRITTESGLAIEIDEHGNHLHGQI